MDFITYILGNTTIGGAMEYYKDGYVLSCEDGKVVGINKEDLMCCQEIN